ncbi:YceI family protein [Undibacterium sp. Jales W-56]|uniref:YceI family protein n=1 Tax=Undibacterium sp. Jales W-56 TaxID=2897325 RepID=UPI0021D14E0B|nr:YceI family protein [Undibacterium sp. Jales W-56]MCU6433000.1 YceI family protein [Undibacterium sp. Jales W-56]
MHLSSFWQILTGVKMRRDALTLLKLGMATWMIAFSLPGAGAADRYLIDPEHTFTVFEYSHWGLSLQRGRFDKNSGVIELDVPNKTGSVQLDIDASSVSTGSALFDNSLRSASFFDTAQFPTIGFKSTALRFDDNAKLTGIDGDLTIKGITHPAKFEITQFNCRFMILYLRSACGANGYTKILRSDFNVGRYVPFVSDEVTLYFSVEAIKE